MRNLVIWTDGSCIDQNTNHKKAASRIVVEDPAGDQTFTYDLGNNTNNIAEITAILKGIEYAVANKARKVEIKTDSRVAIAWINKGPAKSCPEAKKREIETLQKKIQTLMLVTDVTLTWVPSEIQKADFGYKHNKKHPVSGMEISTLRNIANIARKYAGQFPDLEAAINKLDKLRSPGDDTNITS